MYIISKVKKIQSPMKIVEMAHAQLCTSVQLNWHSERGPIPPFLLPVTERPSRGKKWHNEEDPHMCQDI